MKKLILSSKSLLVLITLTVMLFLAILPSSKSLAQTAAVEDGAGIFTADEITSFETQCTDISSTYNTDIYILTTNSTDGLNRHDYLSDYADSLAVENSVLLLICMDPDDRGYQIESFGTAQDLVLPERIDQISEDITPLLKSGSYALATQTFLDDTIYFLDNEPSQEDINSFHDSVNSKGDNKEDSIFFQLWFQLLIAVALSAIIVIIMILNAGGKVTTNAETYLDHNDSHILAQHDHYVRTTLTKHKKPKNNGGGGGATGGNTSGGGRSFNSGGGSF